jgi:hypothetical protein
MQTDAERPDANLNDADKHTSYGVDDQRDDTMLAKRRRASRRIPSRCRYNIPHVTYMRLRKPYERHGQTDAYRRHVDTESSIKSRKA